METISYHCITKNQMDNHICTIANIFIWYLLIKCVNMGRLILVRVHENLKSRI